MGCGVSASVVDRERNVEKCESMSTTEKADLHTEETRRRETALQIQRLLAGMRQVVRGKSDVTRLLLTSMLAGGSVLLEDVPGVGKTTLAKTFAQLVGLHFQRVQCTPDLLPTDIIGFSVLNPKEGRLEFRAGPIFSQLLLVDEINRASPRTQAALLEAMAEGQVTVEGSQRLLPRPFLVIATQNPVGYQGTYPLPEAQLDRFLLQLTMDYPDHESEIEILYQQQDQLEPIVESVVTLAEFEALRKAAQNVSVERTVADYMVRIVAQTRNEPAIKLGASPRGAQMLFRASQAAALIAGRNFVLPDDVQALAVPLLTHRLVYRDARSPTAARQEIVHRIVHDIPVPS